MGRTWLVHGNRGKHAPHGVVGRVVSRLHLKHQIVDIFSRRCRGRDASVCVQKGRRNGYENELLTISVPPTGLSSIAGCDDRPVRERMLAHLRCNWSFQYPRGCRGRVLANQYRWIPSWIANFRQWFRRSSSIIKKLACGEVDTSGDDSFLDHSFFAFPHARSRYGCAVSSRLQW